jgi:hypothetical protein
VPQDPRRDRRNGANYSQKFTRLSVSAYTGWAVCRSKQ